MEGGREEGAGRTVVVVVVEGHTEKKIKIKIKQTALCRNDASFFFFFKG